MNPLFQWPSSIELTSFTRNSCFIGHFKGGKWTKASSTAAASGSNPYTRTTSTVTSFSPFSMGSGSALPIELLTFDAKVVGTQVAPYWTTASEQNNDYFTLERSSDAINFKQISTIAGAGNSDRLLYYNEIDENPLNGTSYYQLKQIDYDEKSSYSKIVSVEISSFNNVAIHYNNSSNEQVFLIS